jgi:anaerobic ribonucleoside-triphosphate reductase activating protein
MNIIFKDYSLATNSYDIFFSGCNASPKCEGCHNPEAWDFSYGSASSMHLEDIKKDIKEFSTLIDKIFLLGGEPLDQDRAEFTDFVLYLKDLNKPIWLFTRYSLEDIPNDIKYLFDYIKCGRYIPSLSTKDNIQYGVQLATSNQHIYKKNKDY